MCINIHLLTSPPFKLNLRIPLSHVKSVGQQDCYLRWFHPDYTILRLRRSMVRIQSPNIHENTNFGNENQVVSYDCTGKCFKKPLYCYLQLPRMFKKSAQRKKTEAKKATKFCPHPRLRAFRTNLKMKNVSPPKL